MLSFVYFGDHREGKSHRSPPEMIFQLEFVCGDCCHSWRLLTELCLGCTRDGAAVTPKG